MGGTTTDRLKTYLAALSPRAQALLARELEREESSGENAALARFILNELRPSRPPAGEGSQSYGDEPFRLVFRPLEPFLIDGNTSRSGAIRRNMMLQAWQWLKREALADLLRRLNTVLADPSDPARAADRAFAISDCQRAAAIAMSQAANTPKDRVEAIVARIGPTITVGDLASMATLLRSRDLFETLAHDLPRAVADLIDVQLEAVQAVLAVPALQSPALMPFALTLTMSHLSKPWQIIRLATRSTGSAAEHDLSLSPYAIAIDMAIEHVGAISSALRNDLRRGNLDSLKARLVTLHDGLRGIYAEIDVRPDSVWGRQLSAIRSDVSKMLRAEFESIPVRVRRLLRQRVAAQIDTSTQIDVTDAQQTAALIAFLATGRDFADELAVHEITTRVWAELTHYVGATSELLISALRGCGAASVGFRRQQVDAAIAFSEVLFGPEHAMHMRRSADHAEQEPLQAVKTA